MKLRQVYFLSAFLKNVSNKAVKMHTMDILMKAGSELKSVIFLLISLSIAALSGCAMLKPVKLPEIEKYTLAPQSVAVTKLKSNQQTLMVILPKSNPSYSDNKMIYVKSPYKISHYSQNQWVSSPATMLLPLIVQTLQDTQYYKAVVMAPYSGYANLQLSTTILQFEQSFLQTPSRFILRANVQLLDLNKHEVIAERRFNIVKSSSQANAYGGVQAANAATAEFLKQLAYFVTRGTWIKSYKPSQHKNPKLRHYYRRPIRLERGKVDSISSLLLPKPMSEVIKPNKNTSHRKITWTNRS